MKKFEIPVMTSQARATDLIEAEINRLIERIEALETTKKRIVKDLGVCVCDAAYTGIHTMACPQWGQRI